LTIVDEAQDGGPSEWSATAALWSKANIGGTNGIGSYAYLPEEAGKTMSSVKMRSQDNDRLGISVPLSRHRKLLPFFMARASQVPQTRKARWRRP
jgi:hypothetical protein